MIFKTVVLILLIMILCSVISKAKADETLPVSPPLECEELYIPELNRKVLACHIIDSTAPAGAQEEHQPVEAPLHTPND